MACPERDNGRNTVSARTEKPDSRVNIITPRVLGTNGNRFGSTSIRRTFSNVGPERIAWSSSQSTARREGSRVRIVQDPSGPKPSAGRGTRTPKGRSPPDFESGASTSSTTPADRE